MSDARNASDDFMEEWQKAIRTRIFWDLLQQIGTYIRIFQRRGEGGCWSRVMCKGEEGGRVGVKGMEQSTLLLLVNQVCLTSFYWHEGVFKFSLKRWKLFLDFQDFLTQSNNLAYHQDALWICLAKYVQKSYSFQKLLFNSK